MEKVLIFGGTGFIGLSLAKHLKEKGMIPVLIARNKPSESLGFEFGKWDALTVGAWKELLNNAKAVVNLAGSQLIALLLTAGSL